MAQRETVTGLIHNLDRYRPLDCVYVKDKAGNLFPLAGFDSTIEDEPILEIGEVCDSDDNELTDPT